MKNYSSTFSTSFQNFRAVEGCTYIMHIASPWPIVADETIIKIAKDGTLNVLKAAAKCGTIRKIVLTSSTAAISGNISGKNKNNLKYDILMEYKYFAT